jgi:predicted small lipoprotein YifL
MKKTALYIILILMVTALAACGPKPAPTMSPADAQGTAVAAAWTVVAMTQASIPTATAIPPTATPNPTALPTWTPQSLPTSPAGSFPTQSVFVGVPTNPPGAGGPTADTCNLPVSSKATGQKVNTRIINQTDGNVVLSLYLSKTVFNECGYYSFNIGPNASITVQLLEGSYWAGAFVTAGKKSTKTFGTSLTLKSPSTSIRITEEFIK